MVATPGAPSPDAATLRRLLAADDADGALETGLMAFATGPAHADLAAAQARFAQAWAAKARFDARNARLALRAHAREAARVTTPPGSSTADGPVARPALPPAAAAALARARARAGRA